MYCGKHHHLMHTVHNISGAVLWANLHLLFWLSLIPFVSGWIDENHFAMLPVAAYGVVLLMCALAYSILVRVLVGHHQHNAELAEAIGTDRKGWISLGLYLLGVALSFVNPWIGFAVYAAAAIMWIVPDPRIEQRLARAPR